MTTHEPRIPAALAQFRALVQQLRETFDPGGNLPDDCAEWSAEHEAVIADLDAALAALGEPEKEKSVAPQIDNRLNENTRQWGRIYCPSCSEVKALLIDHMDGDLNPHDALDIMCGDCRFVIATLHGPSAALGEPPAPPVPQWQPIETAPKDRTVIGALIRDGKVWRVHEMKHNGLAFYMTAGGSLPLMTHWMPLPEEPDSTVPRKPKACGCADEQWCRTCAPLVAPVEPTAPPPLTKWAAQLVRIVCFADLARNVDDDVAEPVREIAREMAKWPTLRPHDAALSALGEPDSLKRTS